jgi:FkbM family methyltransferase
MSSLFQKLCDYQALFGLPGLVLALRSKAVCRPVQVRAKTGFAPHPLTFRLKTSDVPIAVQIFLNQEYAFTPKRPIKTVIDAGANTGFSALYFAERFPEAQIVALEPEQSNFDLLRENTAFCERIHPEKLALWNEDVNLDVVDWFGKCGFRTKRPDEPMRRPTCETVAGISIPSLMSRYGMEQIDFLKMDIEGAEKTILSGNPEWLSCVGVLAVELHDWLDPDCSNVFQQVAASFDVCWVRGENHFCAHKGWAECTS